MIALLDRWLGTKTDAQMRCLALRAVGGLFACVFLAAGTIKAVAFPAGHGAANVIANAFLFGFLISGVLFLTLMFWFNRGLEDGDDSDDDDGGGPDTGPDGGVQIDWDRFAAELHDYTRAHELTSA